ncbi:hypothetical protein ACXR0O_00915 [Verrucomicrobiota bacterium sgz303538]
MKTPLSHAVTVYESEPTGEKAAEVWTAFARVDAKLVELKRLVAHRVGGRKAEAEIERIELQRLRDEQMTRFAKAQVRMVNALAALDVLAEARNSGDGVRAAASVIARGLGTERSAWTRELRALQGRLEMP